MRMKAALQREDRKCKLCFEEKKGLIYIFEVSGSLKNVARIISEVLMYEASRNDEFPPYVCTTCSDKLYEFHDFKGKCDSLREKYKVYLINKEARNASNIELSQSDLKKEEISDPQLNDPLCTTPSLRSPKAFQVLENVVKTDEEEVPVGNEDFPLIVGAFPINAADDPGKQDLDPLGVPLESEVLPDRGAVILPEDDHIMKDAAKEEEVELPIDGVPFIVSAFPVEADDHVSDTEEEVPCPSDLPVEAEDSLVVHQEDDDDAEVFELVDEMQISSEEEGRKLRPRKPTNYSLDCQYPGLEGFSSDSELSNYTLSEPEDDSCSSSDESSIRRNSRVRNKANVATDFSSGFDSLALSPVATPFKEPNKPVAEYDEDNITGSENPHQDGRMGESSFQTGPVDILLKRLLSGSNGTPTIPLVTAVSLNIDSKGFGEKYNALPVVEKLQAASCQYDTYLHHQQLLSTSESTNSVVDRTTESINQPQASKMTAFNINRGVKRVSSGESSKASNKSVSKQLIGSDPAKNNSGCSSMESKGGVSKMSESSEEDLEDAQEEEERQLENKQDYLCDLCGKVFHCGSSFYIHTKIHQGKRPFGCDKCPKTFRTKAMLEVHRLAHANDRPFKCDKCPKRFKSKLHLQQHGISHTGKRKYPCMHCEDSFRTRYQFVSHQKKHKGKVLWPCDCGEKCKSWDELEKHQEEHKRNRTFKCEVCSKVFRVKSLLSAHMQAHTKPFQCSVCDKSFSSKRECKDHEISHTGERPYECEVCGMRFFNRNTKRAHWRNIHYELKRFKCRFCDFRTKYRYDWKKHERRHENGADKSNSEQSNGNL